MTRLDEKKLQRTVLIAEDNLDDVELARETFRRAAFSVDLHHVGNGHECMQFLKKTGQYADSPSPDLVLLDLNMPAKTGWEVLADVAKDPTLCCIPIIVLTTSNRDDDILESYRLGCRTYMVKPVDVNQFQRLIDKLCEYWFGIATLPPTVN